MDYSYFSAAPQPYQLFGLPPTPATTHTPQPEDYGNGSPSDQYAQFHTFDPSFRFDHSALVEPPQSPTQSLQRNSSISVNGTETNGNAVNGMSLDNGEDQGRRSSSEEKESLTPAQSRRKAQNRAAQRAFRERKERHVKDLEQKLTTLEQTSTSLHADNERLKRELAKIATENEILRATSGSHTNGHLNGHGHSPSHHSPITTTGPLSFSPTDFYSSVLHPHHSKTPSHRITVSETTGERLLAAGATWDLIQSHELFKRGLVDVGDVCERLKRVAKCDGQGPVFEEGDVRRAIEESVAGGSDELI